MDDVEPSRALAVAMEEVRHISGDVWTEGHISELALRLDRVKALAEKLTEIRAWLEIDLADRMEADEVRVPGIGRLVRTKFTSSGWKYDGAGEQLRNDLANAVAVDVSMDIGSGEIDPIKRNIALAAIRAAYEAIPAFASLKAAGPKRFGVKISDYRNYAEVYRVNLEVGEL
jgi:hypothetical protein